MNTVAKSKIDAAVAAARNTRSSNVRKAALLSLTDYYTVLVAFDLTPFSEVTTPPELYTYLVPEALKLTAGDVVVVPARTSFGLAKVYHVDATPQVNLDLADNYRWVVDRVDFKIYEQMVARDNDLQQVIADAERVRLHQQMREQVSAIVGPEALAAATAFLKGPEKAAEPTPPTPMASNATCVAGNLIPEDGSPCRSCGATADEICRGVVINNPNASQEQ